MVSISIGNCRMPFCYQKTDDGKATGGTVDADSSHRAGTPADGRREDGSHGCGDGDCHGDPVWGKFHFSSGAVRFRGSVTARPVRGRLPELYPGGFRGAVFYPVSCREAAAVPGILSDLFLYLSSGKKHAADDPGVYRSAGRQRGAPFSGGGKQRLHGAPLSESVLFPADRPSADSL